MPRLMPTNRWEETGSTAEHGPTGRQRSVQGSGCRAQVSHSWCLNTGGWGWSLTQLDAIPRVSQSLFLLAGGQILSIACHRAVTVLLLRWLGLQITGLWFFWACSPLVGEAVSKAREGSPGPGARNQTVPGAGLLICGLSLKAWRLLFSWDWCLTASWGEKGSRISLFRAMVVPVLVPVHFCVGLLLGPLVGRDWQGVSVGWGGLKAAYLLVDGAMPSTSYLFGLRHISIVDYGMVGICGTGSQG